MARVTLSRALKLKNRQVKTLKGLEEQVSKYNSVVAGSDKPFDVAAKFEELEQAARKLAATKAAIQRANAPIQPHIFEMAELRGLISFLQRLDTKSGKNVYGFQGEVLEFEAAIDASAVEDIRVRLEERLDALQDEVDAFNATTQVDLPD